MSIANKIGVGFFVHSEALSGAEKRIAKIVQRLTMLGITAVIFCDTKIFNLYRGTAYVESSYLRSWRYPFVIRLTSFGRKRLAKFRKAVGLENLHLALVYRYWRKKFEREGVSVSHVFLNPAICRDLPGPKVYEITSPDMARVLEKKASEFPGDFFPPGTLLRPNSESVEAALGPTLRRWQIRTAQNAVFIPDMEQEIDLHNKEDLIVFAHRLVARKNPLVFAEAVKQFLITNPQWKIAILGDGDQKSKVVESLKNEIQKGQVEVAYVSNVQDYLARSKIFVSIESEDNYSNQSVLEAMWAHNALLLTDRGATRKRFFDGNAVLCDPTLDSVSAALQKLVGPEYDISEMAQASRNLLDREYSVDAYLEQLIDVYQSFRK